MARRLASIFEAEHIIEKLEGNSYVGEFYRERVGGLRYISEKGRGG
jgi:hypothetical protein